jgi:hypothetical protein
MGNICGNPDDTAGKVKGPKAPVTHTKDEIKAMSKDDKKAYEKT